MGVRNSCARDTHTNDNVTHTDRHVKGAPTHEEAGWTRRIPYVVRPRGQPLEQSPARAISRDYIDSSCIRSAAGAALRINQVAFVSLGDSQWELESGGQLRARALRPDGVTDRRTVAAVSSENFISVNKQKLFLLFMAYYSLFVLNQCEKYRCHLCRGASRAPLQCGRGDRQCLKVRLLLP